MENKFYIYAHINKLTKDIFYIGKGKDRRAYDKNKRNKKWKQYTSQNEYQVIILQDNMLEDDALKLEEFLIKKIGRENLCNLTDGGESGCGYQFTEEHKNYYKELFKGQKNPFYGKKHNQETINLISQKNKGKERSEFSRKIASEICKNRIGNKHPMYGKKHKEETKLKISNMVKGENNPMFGKKHTQETRKKISEKMSGENNYFYGKKRPDHSKLMSENNPSSVKIKYNDKIYNSIIDLWKNEFSDIK